MKTGIRRLTRPLGVAAVVMACAVNVRAQTIFTDSFDAGASALWSNLRGGWLAANGVYFATNPQNIPADLYGSPLCAPELRH